ncbi:hypothetical protein M8494_09810 [Serratia ureilytica]
MPIVIPIGAEDHFSGVVDLVRMKAICGTKPRGMNFSFRKDPGRAARFGAGGAKT